MAEPVITIEELEVLANMLEHFDDKSAEIQQMEDIPAFIDAIEKGDPEIIKHIKLDDIMVELNVCIESLLEMLEKAREAKRYIVALQTSED